MRRHLKYLRIALTIFCAVVAGSVALLWVRSYRQADQIYGHTSAKKVLHFGSMCGQLTLRRIANYNGTGIVRNWLPESNAVSDIMKRRQRDFPDRQHDLLIYRFNSPYDYGLLPDGIYFPHWFLITVLLALGACPWIRPSIRFRLRTLLIAFTAVAIAIGLTAIVMRS
jgi:hypothetical protein